MELGEISTTALMDALFSQSGVGVAVCGADGRLQEFNGALEAMVGPALPLCAHQDWVHAFHLFDSTGSRPLRPEEVPLVRAFRGEVVVDEVIVSRPPGRPERRFRCTAAPLVNDRGAGGALVLVTEVVEPADDPMPALAAQLARYQTRMSRLSELSVRVSTLAGHQVRTPLTIMQSHVELLEGEAEELPESARRSLAAIRRGLTSLTDATTALSLANELANASDPSLEAVDLLDVAQRATVSVRAAHPSWEVRITTGSRHHVPTHADPWWVRRAIVALVDAMPGSGAVAGVALELLDHGDLVGVRVTQLGPGASPPDDVVRTWTGRGDSSTDACGLGLALAEAVALAHDGQVEVCATPGGPTATLLLSRTPGPVSP
jgi:signal transduction histidine kinase